MRNRTGEDVRQQSAEVYTLGVAGAPHRLAFDCELYRQRGNQPASHHIGCDDINLLRMTCSISIRRKCDVRAAVALCDPNFRHTNVTALS